MYICIYIYVYIYINIICIHIYIYTYIHHYIMTQLYTPIMHVYILFMCIIHLFKNLPLGSITSCDIQEYKVQFAKYE